MLKGTELAFVKSSNLGATSLEYLDLKKKYVSDGISNLYPIVFERGKGAVLQDIDKNRYLDFYAGIGVNALGHCHDCVVEAIKAQADKLLHTCFMVSAYDSYIKLAQKICEITPGNFKKKAMFVNSGAEAVENAVKIARAATGRQGIIAFESGYHGRTLLTMTLTSKVHPYKHGFGPYAPEIYKVPFPNQYRSQLNVTGADITKVYLEYFNRFFTSEVDPSNIAGIILEPVQGEGGFNIPPFDFWKGLRDLCDKYGILLIADEVQTGFCRTGKMFAVENFETVPDIMVLAKAIGSGMPLAAVVGKQEIMDAVGPGRIGGTYGGNPVACEAGIAAIDFMIKNKLWEKATSIGLKISSRMKELQNKYTEIGDVRNLGAMVAVEFVKDRKTKYPFKEVVPQIVNECLKRGLLVIGAGIYSNIIRFLPPLVLTDEQLNQGMDIFEESVKKVLG